MLLCFISIQHKPNQPQQPCDKLSLWPKGLQPGADVPKLISKLKLKCSFRQIGFAAVWRGWRCWLCDFGRIWTISGHAWRRTVAVCELRSRSWKPTLDPSHKWSIALNTCSAWMWVTCLYSLASFSRSLTHSLALHFLPHPKVMGRSSFIFQNSFSALELRIFNSGFTLTGGLWAWGINGAGLWSSMPAWDSFPALPHWCDSVGSTWPRGSSGPLRPQLTRPGSLLLSILNTSNTSF